LNIGVVSDISSGFFSLKSLVFLEKMSENPQEGVTEVCNLLVLKFLEQSGHEKIAKKFRKVTNTTTGKNNF